MLIWIKGALSPQQIRDKLMDPDGVFQKEMIAYLELCHVGEFLTGNMAEVKARVPYRPKRREGLHDIVWDEETKPNPVRYTDPTQTLPSAPPPECTVNCSDESCSLCQNLQQWWRDHAETVDDLILRSNVH
ncbi:hypothetical protein R3P38DRAFT_2380789, partial [Favolaschia claudopus]